MTNQEASKMAHEWETHEHVVWCCCGPDELLKLTQEGWRMTGPPGPDMVRDEVQRHQIQEAVVVPGSQGGPPWVNNTILERAFVVRGPQFLLWKPQADHDALTDARKELADARRANREQAQRLETQGKDLQLAIATLHEREKLHDEQRRSILVERQRANAMELDIAKLRQALGDVRMKEILG